MAEAGASTVVSVMDILAVLVCMWVRLNEL